MLFEPNVYFHNLDLMDNQCPSKIHKYNEFFENGIFICHKLLFYFIMGSYSKTTKDFKLSEEELTNYKTILRLFEEVKKRLNKIPSIYITPHIFTKFVNEMRNRNIPPFHFENILNLFIDEFGYIQEDKEIGKEDIIDFSHFKKKDIGISETVLLILKNNLKNKKEGIPCILSESNKVLCDYNNDFLNIDFNEMLSCIKEEIRRNKIN